MTYTKEAFDTHNRGTGLPIEQQVSLGNKIKTLLVSPHLEDVEFAQKLEIEFQSFNFSEPPLRGYSRQEIFANNDPIFTEVYDALSKLIKSSQCELIVSPDLHYASRLTLKQIKGRAYFISRNIKYRKINITSIFNEKTENIKLYKTQARRILQIMIKSHALRLGMENKNLKENIGLSNLFKYLIFLFTNKCMNVPLYERICYIQEAR
jgi:hypothetical protein